MAEKTETNEAPKKKFPLKTMIILAAVLLIEAVVVSAVWMVAGAPEDVKADGAVEDLAAQMEQPVEVLLVQENYQNTRTGRPYIYDTEIFVVVKRKYEPQIKDQIEQTKAQISTEIATIFRRAEPAHLLEPELSTLTRQIHAALDNLFGYDDQGEPYIQDVLIRKCMQYRADM